MRSASWRVRVVGGIPEPIGGVTNFVASLARHCQTPIQEVIDLYPSENKVDVQIERRQIQGNRVQRLAGLAAALKTDVPEIVHFNFSRLIGCLLLLLLRKSPHAKWLLMFHHGDLETGYRSSNFVVRLLIRTALNNRVDGILAASSKQKEFLSRISHTKILQVRAYIKSCKRAPRQLTRLQSAKNFLISGYPTANYQHLEVIELFKSISQQSDHDFCLHLVLYGKDSEGLGDSIRSTAQSCDYIRVYESMPTGKFNELLCGMDLYVRMTKVDSFGLVVAEALELGVPVIASNVCDRYPGAFLIQPNDFALLRRALERVLEDKPIDDLLPKQIETSEIVSFEMAYDSLAAT